MDLSEFKEEFEAFKKTLPDPRMVARRPEGAGLPEPDPALDHIELMFYRWWASMVGATDQFRALLLGVEFLGFDFLFLFNAFFVSGVEIGPRIALARIGGNDWILVQIVEFAPRLRVDALCT